jgi:hypothetical protein
MLPAGYHRFLIGALPVSLLALCSLSSAQMDQPAPATQSSTQSQQDEVDPLKRPIPDKRKKENAKSYKQELKGIYKKWLDEDVVWIISDDERATFKQLSNDEERDQFIEAFWQRRDPTPDT